MPYPTIYFLRHGETEWNAERRLQGQMDSPLTAKGLAHAQAQRALLTPILRDGLDVYCSPLGRARQTAAIAAPDTTPIFDPRLSEINAGAWEGLTHSEIETEWPDLYPKAAGGLEIYCAAPKGEGFERLQARIMSFAQSLTAPSVVIAHGLWGQVIRGLICGVDRADLAALSYHQGVIYKLEQGREIVLR